MPEPQPFSRPILSGGLALGLLGALAACAAIVNQWWVIGSSDGGWTYNYVQEPGWEPLLVAAVTILGVVPFALVPARSRGRSLAVVLTAILVATGSHYLLRSLAPHSVEAVFVSPGANSFYTFAQQVEPAELLKKFERVTRVAPLHAQSNLPGKTLLIHALQRVSDRPDVLPWLLVILSNLGALLIYAVAHELFGDERASRLAALLYLFTPSRVFFFPIMNVVTPVIVLAFTWVVIRWLRTTSTVDALIGGILLYVLVVFEPLPLVMGLFFLTLAVAAILRRELASSTFVLQGAAMASFFVLTAVVAYELTGFHLVRAFGHVGAHAVEFNQLEGREYWVWVQANPAEFVFGAGPAPFVLVFAVLLATWWRRTALRAWAGSPPVAVSLGLLSVLIVTDLIGINRGEVIRLWIFLACSVQLPAAWACARLGPAAAAALLAVTILQVALGIATIAFVVP